MKAMRDSRVLHARVRTTGTGGQRGSGLTDCGCGNRISQALGVMHDCSAVDADYNTATAYKFTLGDLPQAGLAALSGATIILQRNWSAHACVWSEADDEHDLTCLGSGGTEDTESGHFELGLIANTSTFNATNYTLHPKAVLYWVTDDAGDGGITCGYEAVAFCESFDPLNGGMFKWQPGACLQVAGCICVTPYVGQNTCADCEQPPQLQVALPTLGDPTATADFTSTEINALWPGDEYSGGTFSIGHIRDFALGQTPCCNTGGYEYAGPFSGDLPCQWGCGEFPQALGGELVDFADPSEYTSDTCRSCGGKRIPTRAGSGANDWRVEYDFQIYAYLYKSSTVNPSSWAIGGSGWTATVHAIWSAKNRDGGGGPVQTYEVNIVWAANLGVAETEICVPGEYTLTFQSSHGGITSDSAFSGTEVTLVIPESPDLTDANSDGVPEYQPCDSDAADDCPLEEWEWIEDYSCPETTVWCVETASGYIWTDLTGSGCWSDDDCGTCDAYSVGDSCVSPGSTYTGWVRITNNCDGDCVPVMPSGTGTAGEIQETYCERKV